MEEKTTLELVEEEIKKLLKAKDINCDKYFGELKDTKNFRYELTKLPLVFTDFIGSKPIDMLREDAKFNLYEVHISYSKNKATRALKHYELYELQKVIKNSLHLTSFTNTEPLKVGKLEKIFDAVTQSGYLTVFKQELSIIIKEGETY